MIEHTPDCLCPICRLVTTDPKFAAVRAEALAKRSGAPSLAAPAPSNPNSLDCVHRGEVVKLVECAGCSGKTQIKIFACAIHGECSLSSKTGDEYKRCALCADRQPPLVQIQPPRDVAKEVATVETRPRGWNREPEVIAFHNQLFNRSAAKCLKLDYPGGIGPCKEIAGEPIRLRSVNDAGETKTTTQILDNLAVGSFLHLEEMERRGWVALALADGSPEPKRGRKLPLVDGAGNDPERIREAVSFVLDQWRRNERVFVVCRSGANRSPSIAAAAMLAAGYSATFEDAIKEIQGKRPGVAPYRETLEEVRAVSVRPQGERGIVTSGGGAKYFTAAYVLVSVLRKLGCTLPVEWWHIGPQEMDPYMRRLAEELGGVTVRDAEQVEPRPRILSGWASKVVSIYHSRFREVLYLDADQVPTCDPTYLFDDPRYQDKGVVLWPDKLNSNGYDITSTAFAAGGLPVPGSSRLPKHNKPSDYRPTESGQVLIDKSRAWPELSHCLFLNGHEDFFYPEPRGKQTWLCYGDKSLWLLAWFQLHATRGGAVDYFDPPFAMPDDCGWTGDKKAGAFLQRDFSGKVIFQHRVLPGAKWGLHGTNHHPEDFQHADLCDQAIADLRSKWRGAVYEGNYPRPPEGFHCRLDKCDITLYQAVIFENEYRLPDAFPEGAVLLDVGANVGSFAWAAIERGAAQVHCVEPGAENFGYLLKNLGDNPRMAPYQIAAWRSDRPIGTGQLACAEGAFHNAGLSVVESADGESVTLYPFDQLVDTVTWGGQRRIHTLKLDCEGAEWPILFTSRRLHLVDSICGEWHLGPYARQPSAESLVEGVAYSRETLRELLERAGFEVEIKDNPADQFVGWFWARRLTSPPQLHSPATAPQ